MSPLLIHTSLSLFIDSFSTHVSWNRLESFNLNDDWIENHFLQSSWRCSVCRRKLASRDQPIVTQESTDSLLEVPVLEALQRRHSDARLGCQSGSQIGGLGSGLAPPRSPELRRHSDVSPASLKELEKVRRAVRISNRVLLKRQRSFPTSRVHFDSRLGVQYGVWLRLKQLILS